MIFKSVFSNVQDFFTNNSQENKEKLHKAIVDATADGLISAEEMEQILKLQKELDIEDIELNEIKMKVLTNLMQKITEDGEVTQEELNLFNSLKSGLQIQPVKEGEVANDTDVLSKDFMKAQVEKAKGLIGKAGTGIKSGVETITVKVKAFFSKETPKETLVNEPKELKE